MTLYRPFLTGLFLTAGLLAQSTNPPGAGTPPAGRGAATEPPSPIGAPAASSPTVGTGTAAAPAPVLPGIDSVFPATTYPVRDRFNFDINGHDFDGDHPENNTVEVQGQGAIEFGNARFKSVAAEPANGAVPTECNGQVPCLQVTPDGRKFIVYGYPPGHAYQGPMQVRVSTKAGASGWSNSFTLSRFSYRIVIVLTFVVFGVLMYAVYRLVVKGMRDYVVAGRRYTPLGSFLIDKTTDTYSLSKFQLFAISLVAFFGYVYVMLCHVLVQWQFSFPEIPDNYPSLLAISVGTSAAAVGLNATRGGNGGGPVHPSAADFISNGGLVVAERFQFFVWTLIACLGFIGLILAQDPATVSGFPSFPNGLLYVMGVSAAGYLGGKAVRNPGPVLKKILVTQSGIDLKFDLQGSDLDKDASFRIDGAVQQISGNITWSQAPGEPAGYSDTLSFTLSQAANFFDADHTLEIVNGDGIGASGIFTGRPMRILAASPATIPNSATTTVTLDVTDYREKSTARWLAPGVSSDIEIAASDVGSANPPPSPGQSSKVPVKVPAGAATGSGTLTLVSPAGGTEATTITVN